MAKAAKKKAPRKTKQDKAREASDKVEQTSPARGNAGTAGGAGRGVA